MKITGRLVQWFGKTETFKKLLILSVSLALNFVLSSVRDYDIFELNKIGDAFKL
jgi:hypothetical protein